MNLRSAGEQAGPFDAQSQNATMLVVLGVALFVVLRFDVATTGDRLGWLVAIASVYVTLRET